MSFTGNENHHISLQDAAALTKNYRDNQAGSGYILGEYFSRDGISSVLAQSNCVGIRIYYAQNASKVPKLVIVGVTSDENDMVNGNILELGTTCPPSCSTDNDLNSTPA